MCVAIPMGKRDGQSGTRYGRFLRARPSRITSQAALGVLLSGFPLLLKQPHDAWPLGSILLANAAALPVFGLLLERLPARCRGSEIGYPRYGMIGLTMLLAALTLIAGHAGALPGALLFALAWRLAARSLNWQLDWCREPPPVSLRHLPRLLMAGPLILIVFAVARGADAPLVGALAAVLFGLLVGVMASLVLRHRADFF